MSGSGELKWNYLGCYKKNGTKPVLSMAPRMGSMTQAGCLRQAQNNKFFALQSSKGDNCYIGDEVVGDRVNDKECSSVCQPVDELKIASGNAGCGSLERDQEKPFSVYGVTRGIMPTNIKLNRRDFIIDKSKDGEKFKNGMYVFSNSSNAWHWSAKRAFDGNPSTFWMTPYQYGSKYNQKRSKNYLDFNYKQIGKTGPGYYNKEQRPNNRRLMTNPTDKYIVHSTKEAKLDPSDKREQIEHFGEWIQIKYPYKIFVTTYSIHPAKLNPRSPIYEAARMPKHYVLLGSTDGESWTRIDSENNNKFTQELMSSTVTGERVDNFVKPTNENPLGGATKQVITPKSYDHFRLVVKENYGFRDVAIGQLIIRGKVCISMDGNCSVQNNDAVEKLRNGAIKNLREPENFQNMNNNEVITEESFTNMIENEASEPVKELNVFNTDYSKYN
tara:strand:+ start:6809 stop:8137 length:1329 start_codon:yes stop_codon:yes gene_type:complete